MMAQTTRTRARMCLFWEFFTLPPIYGVKTKKYFGGVNRRFPAKLAKSKNVHIIKTTAPTPTKFCTVVQTTKCPSCLVPKHASQIQDGGRRHLGKNRKIAISQPQFQWRNYERRGEAIASGRLAQGAP